MKRNNTRHLASILLLTLAASLNSCAVKVGNPEDGGEEAAKYSKEQAIAEENYSKNETIVKNDAASWNLSCTEAKLLSPGFSKFGCGLVDADGKSISLAQLDQDWELELITDANDKVDVEIIKDQDDLYFPYKVEITASSSEDIVEYVEGMVVTIRAVP